MLKNTMIAAAALASMAVPSVAHAGKYSDKIHFFKNVADAKKQKLAELKADWKSGDSTLTREEYLAKRAKYEAALDKLADRIEQVKEKRASA